MLIDTHAHILSEYYDDIQKIINSAKEKNILKIINCATNIKNCNEIIELSKQFKDVLYPAVGIHPLEINNFNMNDFKKLDNIINNNKIIAIGEIGLDYYYSKDNKKEQIKIFKAQLDLAEKYNLPVIIHSREAIMDTINILKSYNLKGVIHSYSGSYESAKQLIKMGYCLGVNGIVTFKNSKNIKNVVKDIGINHFILETDSPYLTPEGYRKNKNESKYIEKIASYLSELLSLDIKEIMDSTTSNAMRIFDFSSVS